MKQLPVINVAELQLRIAGDDEAALRALYGHYSGRLLRLAWAIVHSREMAEEIVADVFIRIWEQRAGLARITRLHWYLYVTTKNISISYLRRQRRNRHIQLDEATLPDLQLDVTPEDLMISGEALQRIHAAINSLPPRCRLIFKLVKEDGLKYREVAELLHVNMKTVENQMGIALKRVYAAVNIHLHDSPRHLP